MSYKTCVAHFTFSGLSLIISYMVGKTKLCTFIGQQEGRRKLFMNEHTVGHKKIFMKILTLCGAAVSGCQQMRILSCNAVVMGGDQQ